MSQTLTLQEAVTRLPDLIRQTQITSFVVFPIRCPTPTPRAVQFSEYLPIKAFCDSVKV